MAATPQQAAQKLADMFANHAQRTTDPGFRRQCETLAAEWQAQSDRFDVLPVWEIKEAA